MPIPPLGYQRNRARVIDYINTRPRVFVIDGYAGWDPKYRMNCRVVCVRPYHAIFMKQMLVRDSIDNLNKAFAERIDYRIFNAGEFRSDPLTETVTCETSVNVNL